MLIRGAVLDTIGGPRPYARTRPITVGSLELEPPRSGEVLVRIEAASICHSDLSVVDGVRQRPVPMLLGHEACGRVLETGPDVDLTVGQRLVLTFLPRCGECPACAGGGAAACVNGTAANNAGTLLGGGTRLRRDGRPVLHHLGVSGFASHAVVDVKSVVPVDDDVPADVAALLGCGVLTGGGAVVNAGGVRPGDSVAVVGLGGVGLAAVLVALAHADVTVTGVDTSPEKLAQARQFGAHALSPAEAIDAGLKATVVVEAAGSVPAIETAVALTAPGGRTIVVGLPSPEARLHLAPLSLVAEGRSLVGSYMGSSIPNRDIPRFVELWRSGRLPLERLITSRLTLDEINHGMDELAAGRAIRQIIQFA